MPSYKCIRCDAVYTEGQSTRCQIRGGHCQTCKQTLAENEDILEDLEGHVRAGKDNHKIHDMRIKNLSERMERMEGVQETVKDELIPQVQERLDELENKMETKISEINKCTQQQSEQFQLELQKMKMEMETKIREIEDRAKQRDQQFQLELQKIQAQQNEAESQSKIELAKIESEKQIAIMKEKCKAEIEITKLQTNSNVGVKKELNKGLDKLNKSNPTPSIKMAYLQAFAYSSNTPRSNSTVDNEPTDYDTSLEDNNSYPSISSDAGSGRRVDAPTEKENVKWTKVHHRSAPLKGFK